MNFSTSARIAHLLAFCVGLICINFHAYADDVHGLWFEPETGVSVEMRSCDGDAATLCGWIVRAPETREQIDRFNPDPSQRSRPLLNLQIVTDFQKAADANWEGGGDYGRLPGRIYVPASGDTLGDHRNRYRIRVVGDKLTISIANCGFLGCLGKSEWQRIH